MKRLPVNLILLSLLFATLFTGCAPKSRIVYSSEVLQGPSFKTFEVGKASGAIVKADTAFFNSRISWIRSAITNELNALGYSKSPDPETRVDYYLFTKVRKELKSIVFGTSLNQVEGATVYYNPKGISNENYNYFVDGILVIEIRDSETQETIWKGTANGYLLSKKKEDPEAQIRGIVSEIFRKFKEDHDG